MGQVSFCELADWLHTLTEWAEWLYLAEFWFNTNYHTATKMTPHEALYGFGPPRLIDYVPGTTQVAAVDSILQYRQQILTLLKQNLVDTQARMKQQDLHRTERVFKVGEWVYLKLQPCKQQSTAYRGYNKLSPRFFWSLQSFGEDWKGCL